MINCRQVKRFLKRVNLLLMCPMVIALWVIVRHTVPERAATIDMIKNDQKLMYVYRQTRVELECGTRRKYMNAEVEVPYTTDASKNLLMCVVPNIAESFQNDLVNAEPKSKDGNISLNTSNNVKDNGKSKSLTVRHDNAGNIGAKYRDYTSVLITGDPYWRLYNLYIDDIVLPSDRNTVWKRRFNETFQYWAKVQTKLCMGSVSFPHFIRYVIRNRARDRELQPIAELCGVCHKKYDIIAKLDTIDDDTLKFSEHFRLKSGSISPKLSKQQVNANVVNLVNRAFYWFNQNANKACVTKLDIAQRVWKTLKMRGILRNSSPFPKKLLEGDFSPEDLLTTIKLDSYLPFKLYHSSYENVIVTYKLIPFKDKKAIGELYNLDFLTFEYETYPKRIFEYLGPPRTGDVPSTYLTKMSYD